MQSTLRKRPSIRLAMVTTVASATLLGGAVMSAAPASADPSPPKPTGAETTIPEKFRGTPTEFGDIDSEPNEHIYYPITTAQIFLKTWKSDLKADGNFEEPTRSAVSAFEKDQGLPQDGKLDRKDTYVLYSLFPVKYGSTGPAVERVQNWLVSKGLADDLDVDGSFGPATRRAVVAAQERWGSCFGTEADGIVGPMTRAMTTKGIPDSYCAS